MENKQKELMSLLIEFKKLSIEINNKLHLLEELEHNTELIKEKNEILHEAIKEVLKAINQKENE